MGTNSEELEQNGAVIYYGNHQSAASVIASGDELQSESKKLYRKAGVKS
ncbi:MAG: hypothetical protein ACLRQF_12135 [Thomasclavelia ramosa]